MRPLTIAAALGAGAIVSIFACAPTDTTDKSATPAPAVSSAAAPLPRGDLTADQTMAVFTQVCWQTAPDFLGARDAMAAAGLTDRQSSGAVFAPGGAISAKIQQRAGAGGLALGRCSVVAKTADRDGLAAALERLAGSAPRAAVIGRSPALIWDVTPGGRTARLLMIQAPGRPDETALYLDVPSARTAA